MKLHPASADEKLGFGVIRASLEERLLSALGMEALERARPQSDADAMLTELNGVSELQQVVRFDDPLPLRNLHDIRPLLKRAAPEESYLEGEELAAVRQVLETTRLLHGYFEGRKEQYPTLVARTSGVTPLASVESAIESAVDEQGAVRDDASVDLRRLRAEIARTQNDLRRTLQQSLRDAVSRGYATEEQPTVRGGRMVIPVRAEARRKVPGFVHDTSATGQTLYVEPAACLDLNNEVRSLESAERREVQRILRRVTDHLRAHIFAIRRNLEFLGWLDFAHARARLANEMVAVVPNLNADGMVDVIDGRNPSLLVLFGKAEAPDERKVVPLDLRLDDARRTIVITGPNAGGKTVAMKTVGLFVIMLGYGMPIPVDEKSTLCLFETIYVDIGDEQSIEEDLSTFSSHVANLRRMVEGAGPRALMLIDEAGTGTDPDEGAALARAVLEVLTERGARTIATTHHGALKAFAHETRHLENGSMEFDQESLRPTYRFKLGVPGSSYAFPISRRQGLPPGILERAAALLGTQKTSFESLVHTFQERTRALEERIAELGRVTEEAVRDRDLYRERLQELQRERNAVRAEALREAERVVAEANARVERTIREIKEAQAARDATHAARSSLEEFGEDLHQRRNRAERKARRHREAARAPGVAGERDTIEVGDRVVLDAGATPAEVVAVDEGSVTIVIGSARVRTHRSRVTKVSGGDARRRQRVSRHTTSGFDAMRSLQAHTSVDVRGKRAAEAVSEVVRLVDDAVAANLEEVEVVHGKGTGALRAAIRESLDLHGSVAAYEDAPWDRGGPGVTIIRLK